MPYVLASEDMASVTINLGLCRISEWFCQSNSDCCSLIWLTGSGAIHFFTRPASAKSPRALTLNYIRQTNSTLIWLRALHTHIELHQTDSLLCWSIWLGHPFGLTQASYSSSKTLSIYLGQLKQVLVSGVGSSIPSDQSFATSRIRSGTF